MKRPVITSEYKMLFHPELYGCYVNDHALIRAVDGSWHLFGITCPPGEGRSYREKYFVHAKADHLIQEAEMDEVGVAIDKGTLAWSPCVVEHEKSYYMYYGPSPSMLAVSPDLGEWMGYEMQMVGNPPMSCHRDHFVMRLNDYTWIMYVTGIKDHKSSVAVLVSNDLLSWRFVQYALTSNDDTPLNPPWGAFESPYVVKQGDTYYLFVTYTDCAKENYLDTLVFASTNPYDFGEYSLAKHDEMVVAKLQSHAGEVIFDEETDSWYITTCGWRGLDIPCEGGVGIAKLEWVED